MADLFFKNISVKWRLIGFVSFLLLLMVASGTGGIWGMKSANESLSIVYHHHVSPLKDLRDIDNLFQKDILGSVEHILFSAKPPWEKSLNSIEQAKLQLDTKWAALLAKRESGSRGKQEKDWASYANPLIEKTNEITSQLIPMIRGKEINSIDELHDKQLTLLAKDYTQKIDMFVLDGLNSTKAEYERSQSNYEKSRTFFAVSVLIGIIISIVASFILLQDINVSFHKVKEVIKHMLQGDLTKRLNLEREDEFGLLADGFNQMATYICDLVTKIQKSGIQVTSSITEIAASIRQQEVTANEHAATTSEIAASTTEIAATSANLTNTMKKVNSLTKNAAFAAEEGHSSLQNIDNTMSRMEQATSSIVEKLSILSEKAGNIAGVVKTIHKVADQTNLLSLNAAIEAEKAGEYGAGFAVVATEIRRLADQTAVATFDIEQMVQEVQSAVSAGVMGIDKFAEDVRTSVKDIRQSGEILGSAIEQVAVLMPQINTVNDGIEAQSLGAKQISEATNQLNDAAQQTAESIAQTSVTIGQLQEAASALQEAVSIFKVK